MFLSLMFLSLKTISQFLPNLFKEMLAGTCWKPETINAKGHAA